MIPSVSWKGDRIESLSKEKLILIILEYNKENVRLSRELVNLKIEKI